MIGVVQEFGTAIVIAAFGLFFLLERRLPLRQPRHRLRHRLLVNGVMSVLAFSTAAVLVKPSALKALAWAEGHGFGLLPWLSLPTWLEGTLGFLLLDLSFYYWHRLNHSLPFLWRFHNIHHLDPDLDASTGFRFHFGEVAMSMLFRVIQVLLIGISLPIFVTYELVFQLATYFHHSNLRLPASLDRWMNVVVVTPRMHGIHHSDYRSETDSNYSVVLSIWDRIHRSFITGIPQESITVGVPGYAAPADNRLTRAVFAPFVSQTDYWRGRVERKNPHGLTE